MKGKPIAVKRNFCNSDRFNAGGNALSWNTKIMEYGNVEQSGTDNCTLIGDEFNPL